MVKYAAFVLFASVFAASFARGTAVSSTEGSASPSAATVPVGASQVFEMRTYTTAAGKLDALNARFRDHTMRLFEKHGMVNIGYWIPQDSARSKNTLIYVIAHPSRELASKHWAEFVADPEWQRVAAASEANGKILVKIESVFMTATDYSQIK
jgi:hypothetical protein